MNGPEHYAEAERLLTLAGTGRDLITDNGVPASSDTMVAAAQVHATLALAAATAQSVLGREGSTADAWVKAIAVRSPRTPTAVELVDGCPVDGDQWWALAFLCLPILVAWGLVEAWDRLVPDHLAAALRRAALEALVVAAFLGAVALIVVLQ